MKQWRPDNWVKLNDAFWDKFFDERDWRHWEDASANKIFEAGADAMLEALKKESGEFIDLWGLPKKDNRKGWMVFIPEEGK